MRTAPLIAAVLLASGCNRPASPPAPSADQAAPTEAAATPATRPPLTPLSAEQIRAADLGGELGCAFAVPGDPGPLLVAMGRVADAGGHAQALGAADTGPQRLEAAENGGFDAMLNGAAFAAGGRSYTVTLIEGAPSTAGGESPPMPARLDVTGTAGGPDQPAMAIIGEWTCGP